MIRFLPLVWRNIGRNKLRSLLTGAAIALATALVCLLRTMPAGLEHLLSSVAKNNRISVHHRAGITYSLPYSYLRKVRSVPGVVEAMSWTYFGGKLEEGRGRSFPNCAVDPEAVGALYKDLGIAPHALTLFQRYRNAALVGRQTLNTYGWRIDDQITLRSTKYFAEITLRIVGEIPDDRIPILLFQREYLEQVLVANGVPFNEVDMIWARVDDPDRVNEVMSAIDEMFRNSEAETASETERSFFTSFFGNLSEFVKVILIVTGLIAVSIVFIAANTASLSVRDRTVELATLKAMGFRWRLLFGILVLEAGVLSTLAGGAGALLCLGLSRLLQSAAGWSPELGPLAAFVVGQAVMVQGLFLAMFIGIVAGVIPAWGASRRSVVAVLREVF